MLEKQEQRPVMPVSLPQLHLQIGFREGFPAEGPGLVLHCYHPQTWIYPFMSRWVDEWDSYLQVLLSWETAFLVDTSLLRLRLKKQWLTA